MELGSQVQNLIQTGTVWINTRRLDDFRRYSQAATSVINSYHAFEERWHGSPPAPGVNVLPVELAYIVGPLVQESSVAADYLATAGRVTEARELRAAADSMALKYLDEVQRAVYHYGARAEQLFEEGHVGEAITILDNADSALRRHGVRIRAAEIRLERASILHQLGDYSESLRWIETFEDSLHAAMPEGLSFHTDIQSTDPATVERLARLQSLTLRMWTLKALLLRADGRYGEAEGVFRELLPHMRKAGTEAAGQIFLAELAWRKGDVARAGDWLDKCARVFETAPQGDFEFNSAALHRQRGAYCLMRVRLLRAAEPDEALRWCGRGLDAVAEYPVPDTAWKLHAERARLLRSREPAQSQRSYNQAARVIDERRRVSTGPRWDSLHLARERISVFHEALDLAATREDGLAALSIIDMLKARSFAARLALLPTPRSDTLSADEQKLADVAATLNALQYGPQDGAAAAMDEKAREQEIRKWRAERRRLVENIRRNDPRWRAITEGTSADLEESSRALAERVWRPSEADNILEPIRRTALSLYRQNSRIVSVLVTADGAQVETKELDTETDRILASYTAGLRATGRIDQELFDPSGSFRISIEDLVPERFIDQALGEEVLLVSPHANLHDLPWQAVKARGKPLVQHTAIGILPNLACLSALDRPPADSVRVSLFGAPEYAGSLDVADLADAERELRSIEDLYGYDRLVSPTARGPQAQVQTLLDVLGRYGGVDTVLHVACHGVSSQTDPYDAGLLLADGTLGIAELASRRIRFEEIVLPVCGLALRPRSGSWTKVPSIGDDAFTMVHLFHEAGAAFVLGSPLPVGDRSARAFAVAWHHYRIAKKQPLAAARAAACDLLESGEYKAHMWAGMTGYGCR